MRALSHIHLALAVFLTACAFNPVPSADFPAATWHDQTGLDAPYLLWTGDTLEINVTTAPELSRTAVIIAPDGRIRVPLAGSFQAAGLTIDDLETEISDALDDELRDPRVFVAATAFGSQQVFVSGQVAEPGVFPLPGQIGPLQAISMAGGFRDTANAKQVLLIRRLPGGEVKSAIYNIEQGLLDPTAANWGPLQRFDIVYVSPSAIARENLFVQQYLRNSLPVDFSLFIDVTGGGL